MDTATVQRLASFVRQGRIVLFTGAGFSAGVRTESGAEVPSAEGLARVCRTGSSPVKEILGKLFGP